jgi:hypothetical protein
MRDCADFVSDTAIADSPDTAVAASDYLLMTLASAYTLVASMDADHPEFVTNINHIFQYAAPNPDATYYFATLDGAGTYRIFGHRNTVLWVNFLFGHDYFGFADKPGKTLHAIDLDDLHINADGSFDIIVSAIRPTDHTGNWIQLDPRADYVLVRQFSYDPEEVDARMGIERLDRRAAPPPRSREGTERRVHEVIRHLRNSSRDLTRFPARYADTPNQLFGTDYDSAAAVPTQLYLQGTFDVPLDQAMVISFDAPPCRYWNIQLADLWWRSLEFVKRRSSLNGFSARPDSDGVTRLVIAHKDPGVANWLDTGEVTRGDMVMRFLHPERVPRPTIQLVTLSELDQNLPSDVKRYTPEQRAEDLRAWMAAKQMRRSW